MAGYVSGHAPHRIAEWAKELSLVPPEKIAEWRGRVMHSSGATLPVRWNKGLAVFEVKVCKAVREHNKEAIPDIIFPADNWTPVTEYGKTISEKVMEHYYGPRMSSGPMEHVMSANSARILAAFEDKNVKGSDEMFKKIVEENAQKKQSVSSQSLAAITDNEWEAIRKVMREERLLREEKLQAEKLQAEKLQAEKLQAKKLQAEKLQAKKLQAEKLQAEWLQATKLQAERLQAERQERLLQEEQWLDNLEREFIQEHPNGVETVKRIMDAFRKFKGSEEV